MTSPSISQNTLPEPIVQRVARSDLPAEIRRDWLGQYTSDRMHQYLCLSNGRVYQGPITRTDVLIVQFHIDHQIVCTVYVEADGSMNLSFATSEGEETLTDEILRRTEDIVNGHQPHLERELRFQREAPWKQVYGLTTEEALNKFAELGWL